MKKILFASMVAVAVLSGANTHAQQAKEPLKKHVCTEACEKAGKHVYAHGEEGHVCTKACKKLKKHKA